MRGYVWKIFSGGGGGGGGLNGNRSCMKSITLFNCNKILKNGFWNTELFNYTGTIVYVVRIVLLTKQRKRNGSTFLSSEAVVNYVDSIILRGILFEQKFSINAGHPWTKAFKLSCITEAEL